MSLKGGGGGGEEGAGGKRPVIQNGKIADLKHFAPPQNSVKHPPPLLQGGNLLRPISMAKTSNPCIYLLIFCVPSSALHFPPAPFL